MPSQQIYNINKSLGRCEYGTLSGVMLHIRTTPTGYAVRLQSSQSMAVARLSAALFVFSLVVVHNVSGTFG